MNSIFQNIQLPTFSRSLTDKRAIKAIISVSGKLLLVSAIYFAYKARVKLDQFNGIEISDAQIISSDTNSTANSNSPNEKISAIKTRNIFGIKDEPKKEANKEIVKKITPLKFRLVGTLITPGVLPIAIIEDSTAKKQDAFEVNEKIFDKAILKEVFPEKVLLDRDGTIETLELQEGLPKASDGESNIQASDGTFTVPEDEITQALANLPVLLSQARAVPYFRNGQSIGMRLYAIKAGSLYEKLGLKNSDIIKEINGSVVNDPTKALKLFEDLKSQRQIKVQVEREGQDVPLQYQVR